MRISRDAPFPDHESLLLQVSKEGGDVGLHLIGRHAVLAADLFHNRSQSFLFQQALPDARSHAIRTEHETRIDLQPHDAVLVFSCARKGRDHDWRLVSGLLCALQETSDEFLMTLHARRRLKVKMYWAF